MRSARSLILSLSVVFLAALYLLYGSPLRSKAGASSLENLQNFDNYDIRLDPSAGSKAKRSEFARLEGSSDEAVSYGRQLITAAGERFRTAGDRVIENGVLDTPEVISGRPGADLLTRAPSTKNRVSIFRQYLSENSNLLGIDRDSIAGLTVAADYTNPDGNLSFVILRQSIDGIPVFSGEIKAAFTKRNEIVRVINNLAPGVSKQSYSSRFGTIDIAITNALGFIPFEQLQPDQTSAEKILFPIDYGVLRPAWQVLLYLPNEAFYVVVDAEDGTLLWRKNLTEKQAVTATFSAYATPAGLMRTADSPTPGTPFTCAAPVGCAQPPIISRTLLTLVGNESPYSFNNLGWIPDTGLPVRTPADPNITDGNNVEAGIDRDGANGVDPQGHAVGSPTRVFDPPYNPAPGNPPPGDDPTPPNPQTYPPTPYQQGLVTQAFYTANRFHDAAYLLGFTEQAGNFQHFNFGRGGAEGDRISLEVQDGSGTNGSTFTVPADGGRGRMQMMRWTGPTPDRDGTLDNQMVVHELSHGISVRLHGNATGLGSNMSRGMGEGWSDFFSLAMLAEPQDSRVGVYAVGGYATYQVFPDFDSNYYYGIRRFPTAIKAAVGPNGLPFDPRTFGYLNSNCNVLIGTTTNGPNSAYPRGPIGVTTCDQVHNIGEIWSTVLWEARDQLIRRHGNDEGTRRVLQYIMDGMKISPLNPTMIQSRDAILMAAQASDANDLRWVWRGFANRGMGISAAVISPGSGSNNTIVTESYDVPIQFRRPTRADFDGDGRTDISVYRPSDRIWYLDRSTTGFGAVAWGLDTDIPVAGDFDGDGKADVAVFRGTDSPGADFYILRSSDVTASFVSWGLAADVPVVEDYDGDGKDDVTIFRPATNHFWILQSSNGVVFRSEPLFPGRPFSGDFDGDGRADLGSFANGEWRLLLSTFNYGAGTITAWGSETDKLIPADYDGDGIDDIAYYRPADGTWQIRRSSGGTVSVPFGIATDHPSPGDFDGDGRADMAIYRNGQWWINGTTSGVRVAHFGVAGDIPIPASNNQ